MQYNIRFTEKYSRVEPINAESVEEALMRANEKYDSGEILIDPLKDFEGGCRIELDRGCDLIKVFLDYFYEDVLPLYLDDIARDPVKGLCDALGDAANHDLGKSKWLDVISREATRQLKDGEKSLINIK